MVNPVKEGGDDWPMEAIPMIQPNFEAEGVSCSIPSQILL